MIFSDVDIQKALQSGAIVIDPIFPNSLQPSSVDLHLGKDFLVFKQDQNICIDPKEPIDHMMTEVSIDEDRQFILHPGQFALALVYETTGVSNQIVGRLEGKSSLGRMGLIIHATAGYLDPGNKLKMTLELSNLSTLPIKLYYKMPIAQMSFHQMTSPASKGYGEGELNSKYFGATKPQASQYYKNFLKNNDWITFK